MLKGPTKHALSLDFWYGFGEQEEQEQLKNLTPHNMRVDFFLSHSLMKVNDLSQLAFLETFI